MWYPAHGSPFALGTGHWCANRQVFPDLHLFRLYRMQMPLPSGSFRTHELSHFPVLGWPGGSFGGSVGGPSCLGFFGSGFGYSGLRFGGSCFGCCNGLGRGASDM